MEFELVLILAVQERGLCVVDHNYANRLSDVVREVPAIYDSDGVSFDGGDPACADCVMRCWARHRSGVEDGLRGNGRHNIHCLLNLLSNLDW